MTGDDADDPMTGGHGVSRRSILRATAWSAPVVAMVTVAPAAAAASIRIPDPVLPVENPLPIPEPTLPQVPVPPALKTVPPPIPGVPELPGRPSVVLPDKVPPKIFKPKNPNTPIAPASEPASQPSSAPALVPDSSALTPAPPTTP